MKKKLIIAFLVLIVLGLASIPALYPLAKMIRAQQHLSSAIALKAEGEDRTAHFKIQSAYNLAPENEEILALVGAYAADVFHPNTLQWWSQAAERGLLERDQMIEMVRFGLDIGRHEAVQPYLYRLSRSHPEDSEVRALQLRLLQIGRRDLDAYNLAGDLVREGIREQEVVSAYVQGAFTVPQVSESEREEALAVLQELAGGRDAVSLFAIRILLQFWNELEARERETVARQLEAHPDSEFPDHLNLLSRQRETSEAIDEERLRQEAIALYQRFSAEPVPDDPGDDEAGGMPALVTFCAWLNQTGFHQTALDYLDHPLTRENAELYHLRQTALIATGKAEEAYNDSLEQNPLTPARNLILRAMAQARLQETEGIRQSLNLAAESVETDEIVWMENILRSAGELELLIRMFEQMESSLPNPLPAQVRLLPYYYAAGQQDAVSRLVREVNPDQLSNTPRDQIPFLYFRILFGQDPDRTRASVEQLVNEMPVLVDFRVLLAFAYAVSGNAPAAATILDESVPRRPNSGQRMLNIMMAFVHIANDDLEAAREVTHDLDLDSLLPQEKALLSRILS
jgi:hypothetical protein